MDAGATSPIQRLLRPRSVAIVGVSPDPAHPGSTVLANLERCRFEGAIHLVSRSRTEFNGRPCVPGIDDLPFGIDVAVLVVPQSVVIDAIAALGRRGVGGAIVFAAGYAEMGDAGRAEQQKLTAAARAANVAVLGPNCIGMCSFDLGAALTFEFNVERPAASARPKIGMAAQSGAMAAIMRMAFLSKGLGITFYISTGNEADLGVEDFLSALVDDQETKVVALFVEQVRKPQLFLEAAARARAAAKPIVLLLAGRSPRAQASARSHTGALAGDYATTTALLRHAGVNVVETVEELLDVTELLARVTPPLGGPGIITNSGAVKGFALDFADSVGLDVPRLAPATVDALRAALPASPPLENPVDITAHVLRDLSLWPKTAAALLGDPGVGSLCLAMVAGTSKYAMDKFDVLAPALAQSDKPALVALLGDDFPVPPEFLAAFREKGVPVLRSTERALRALAHATAYGRSLHERARVRPAQADLPPAPRGGLLEYAGKAYFGLIGIPVPRNILAHDLDGAKRAAAVIGYPVALKAQVTGLAHKSDIGGVILNIADEHALAGGWARLNENLAPHVRVVHSVLVERMADKGVELIVGARRDPEWGPVVMIGLGGIWTEALNDVRLMPADLDRGEIIAEINQLKGARLLHGMRGDPAADMRAAADVIERVSALMRAQPDVTEIDINPLVVYPRGKGGLALDALIVAVDEPQH